MERDRVLVIVPPNSNTVISGRLLTVTRPQEHSDWSDFLCLGALSLVCALEENPSLTPDYIDGTVIPLDDVLDYITENADGVLAVCISALTANYEAGLLIARHAKSVNPDITIVVGNDHFTALPFECMAAAPSLDYGFVGNEVVGPFADFIGALRAGSPVNPENFPGLVYRTPAGIRCTRPQREPVFVSYDYRLVDRAFPQSPLYAGHFQRRIVPRIEELLGRSVTAGVPVDIGRGCVKFANDDACSFCSIQPGHFWRNQLAPQQAWSVVEAAWRSGYDYLYLTADELPMTFATLLSGMSRSVPGWWSTMSAKDRPVLVGYGRADGVANPHKTALLASLGVRQIMIGMDAGAPLSLAAMNKPLGGKRRDALVEAEKLYEVNSQAIEVARDHGLLIRAGFVVGHIGMTRSLLDENLERILALITEGGKGGVFSAVDVEVLSPQPGALDYTYLTSPSVAKDAARRLGLSVAEDGILAEVAQTWRNRDVVLPEQAMRDYTRALMPDLTFEELAQARATIRAHAKQCGVVIGE